MLFLFSFENFRVFDSNQTFPIVADTRTRRRNTCLISNTRFSVVPLIHLQTCFIDPNGSGKTTLIMAIDFLAHYVGKLFRRKKGITIETEQFCFDRKFMDVPSELDITFIDYENLYMFSFTVTPDQVQVEWLAVRSIDALESSVESNRVTDVANRDNYEWKFNPEHFVISLYTKKGLVRPNSIFLNSIVTLNISVLESFSAVFLRTRSAKLLFDEYWYRQNIELIDLLAEEITDAQAFLGKFLCSTIIFVGKNNVQTNKSEI